MRRTHRIHQPQMLHERLEIAVAEQQGQAVEMQRVAISVSMVLRTVTLLARRVR